MADYGVTPSGFRRKKYSAIIENMENRAKDRFGENVNLSERSPLGLFFRVVAWSVALMWQVAENVYNSAFVDTAEGVELDRVATYIGITRRPPTYSEGTVVVSGEEEASVPAGTLFQTEDGLEFYVEGNWSIPEGESSVEVDIKAMETGTEYNVPANTIVEFVEPVEDLDDVTNPDPTSGGMEEETDSELRERYLTSVAKPGASTIGSIRASLLDMDDVRAALVIENNSPDPDEDDRPPHSFESYVLGGEDEDVAEALLKTKPIGIRAYGDTEVNVEDEAGQEHTIGFTHANEIDIYVDVQLETSEEFSADGEAKVVTEIIKYIGGTDEDGSVYAGLSMGEDVIHSKLVHRCFKVDGVEDATVYLDTSSSPTDEDNIEIDQTDVAETDYEKVTVNA